jgi:hydrogenase maturation protein HypF
MTEAAISFMPDLSAPMNEPTDQFINQDLQRWHFQLQGIVQGVGFRPFVYRLAIDLGLTGWVRNTNEGLQIEVEGNLTKLTQFATNLQNNAPLHSLVVKVEQWQVKPQGNTGFQILESQILDDQVLNSEALDSSNKNYLAPSSRRIFQKEVASGRANLGNLILPDLATCKDCVAELFDPNNHRYRYPFLNCTCCGPRYSILQRLPYDRAHTTMADFAMCPVCQREYDDPLDRRFHAQPTACPNCGPQIQFVDHRTFIDHSTNDNNRNDYGASALAKGIELLRSGGILAVKGLGGFHLVTIAANQTAIMELRRRKRRPAKPLAVMVPSVAWLQEYVNLEPLEVNLLESPAAPIVLIPWCERERQRVIAPEVAPDNPYLGVMLPYTPLHHLLLADLGQPIVATSGNLSSETICIDETEAMMRLRDIADGFLIHNRRIVRPVDDSVVRVVAGEPMILRRARGYAPLPIQLSIPFPKSLGNKSLEKSLSHLPTAVLGLGGHLKNTVALGYAIPNELDLESQQWQILVSQHLGDLGNSTTWEHFQKTIHTITEIHGVYPQILGCDSHPDYGSTQFAHQLSHQLAENLVDNLENDLDNNLASKLDDSSSEQVDLPVVSVQHHYAHVLAVMAEHQLELRINENFDQNASPDVTDDHLSKTARVPPSILGVAWDGTGYGSDGTIWGGEFLLVPPTAKLWQPEAELKMESYDVSSQLLENPAKHFLLGYQRIGHWRQFPLVGGDLAVQEPRRALLGLLYGCFGDNLPWDDFPALQSFSSQQRSILLKALTRITASHGTSEITDQEESINRHPKYSSGLGMMTSSVGRLFDGVAALLNLCPQAQPRIDFEGQAAMQLEFAIQSMTEKDLEAIYPFRVISEYNSGSLIIDWKPMIKAILIELYRGVSPSQIAIAFHNTLAATIVMMAQRYPNSPVVLTGGCFQNLYLLSRTIKQLKQHNIPVYWSQKIPCHDGGLSVGQIYGVLRHYVHLV